MKHFRLIFALLMIAQSTFAQAPKPRPKAAVPQRPSLSAAAKGRLVQITTDYGSMVVRLYDSTPLHRDNFIKLVKEKFYDSLMFHRVIESFMIQGGDPESKNAQEGAMLGSGSAPGERVPAEFRNNLVHKKGALAAARDNNPEKASSNCQFYIVQGQKYNDTALNQMECNFRQEANPGFYYTETLRKIYKTSGGTPFLDQNYTVFGEVVSGMEVIDKIAATQKDSNDRPLKDIRMKMRMLN